MDSQTSHKYRSCERKSKLSKARADALIDDFSAKRILMFYYQCKYCGYYHITKNLRDFGKQKLKAKIRRLF